MKKPRTEDNGCYGTDDLDKVVQSVTQELLDDDQLNNSLEEGIDQPDFKKCDDSFDSETPIQRIDQMNTPYSQETRKRDGTHSELLYSASANEINEKRPELKDLPPNLEYAYLKGDESYPMIISSKLTKKEKKIKRKQRLLVLMELLPTGGCRLDCARSNSFSTMHDVGAVLGKRIQGKFKPIYYASKTLNGAQAHYTMIEKGLDFMGLFPDSRGNKYILVAVDYVSKWVEAQTLPTNDARVVVKFINGLFARFGVPKALISDRGTYFCNSQIKKASLKYRVTHRISIAYHPQTNSQTKVTNRAIERILERSIGYNPKDWSEKLNDAL
nr:reverse transcriptase domain-containing protein [Tanacetum cinerariifolium]